MELRKSLIIATVVFLTGIGCGIYFVTHDQSFLGEAYAAEDKKGKLLISPTDARERDFYAPNSETLKPDEMRVIACGTGMPTPRPASTDSYLPAMSSITERGTEYLYPAEAV